MSPSWPEVKLGTLAEFKNGLNYSKKDFGEGLKVIGVSDFGDRGRFSDFTGLDEINAQNLSGNLPSLPNGDILFVRSNGNRELIGRSVLIQNLTTRVSFSGFTIRCRFHSSDADPEFFAYLFKSRLVRDVLSNFGGGTNINNLNQEILSNLNVPLPPLPTQRKIAAILSAYDDLIENNTRRVQVLEQMARALYREWFVEYRFPGHEQAQWINDEQGRRPQGWAWQAISYIAPVVTRGVAPKYNEEAEDLVINQKCIRNQRLSLESARRHLSKVPPLKVLRFGDVLINSTGVGTLGRVAQVYQKLENLTVDTHVTIVRPNPEKMSLDYFGLALVELQPEFESAGVGSTGQTELGRERIGSTPILVPPLQLQNEFGGRIQAMRQLSEQLLKRNANLCQTRDLLLPRLVSGELNVTNTLIK